MAESTPENANETNAQSVNENGEDWDKQQENEVPIKPSESSDASNNEGDADQSFSSVGRSAGRTLAQLMSPHALKGKDIQLSEDEEQRLTEELEELGKWINADTNPYEKEEDPYFAKEATA